MWKYLVKLRNSNKLSKILVILGLITTLIAMSIVIFVGREVNWLGLTAAFLIVMGVFTLKP